VHPARFRVLGPVEIATADSDHPINGSHVRGVLAALLLRANESMPQRGLVDALWDQPPRSARVNIRTFVMKLRRSLMAVDPELDGRLQTRRHQTGATYRLLVEPGEFDLDLFEHAWATGRTALADGHLDTALLRLDEALSLWQGAAGEDVPPGGWVAHHLSGLNEQRVTAEEDFLAARIAKGQAAGVIARLRGLVRANPGRERAAALLLLANYRLGDVPAALNTFTRTRTALVTHFAVEPGPALRRLHVAALARDDGVLLSNRTLVSAAIGS
jgi:DNA-binding SARP family transcriptional activator